MKHPRARLLVFNDPHSMRIDSRLAKEIGFEDSVVLLQLEFLIGVSQHEHDGRLWTFQSLRSLNKEQFPWWSPATLSRIIKRLEQRELVIIGNFNKTEWDKTQWFALNEVGISRLKSVCLAADPFQNETPPVSKRNIDVSKMKHRLDQNETTIPETTTETTQRGGVRANGDAAAVDQAMVDRLVDEQMLMRDQATAAAALECMTWEALDRLVAWRAQMIERNTHLPFQKQKKPQAILWSCLKQGFLPDDLPAPPPPPEEQIIDENGRIVNVEAYERTYGVNKHLYHRG